MPHHGEPGWTSLRLQNRFANSVSNCVENFIDIPHTAFVHQRIFRSTRGERLRATVTRADGAVHVAYRNERGNLGTYRWFLNPRGARDPPHRQLPRAERHLRRLRDRREDVRHHVAGRAGGRGRDAGLHGSHVPVRRVERGGRALRAPARPAHHRPGHRDPRAPGGEHRALRRRVPGHAGGPDPPDGGLAARRDRARRGSARASARSSRTSSSAYDGARAALRPVSSAVAGGFGAVRPLRRDAARRRERARAAGACCTWCRWPPTACTSALWPLAEGRSRIDAPGYSPWWGGHQCQVMYTAFPALEAALRLVPGVYSAWLRLWGSRVGRGVYWTPLVEITDRALLEVGDGVVFGHRVACYAHLDQAARATGSSLYVRRIRIGDGALLGAGSRLGPGAHIDAGVALPLLTDVGVGRRDPQGGLTRARRRRGAALRAYLRAARAALRPRTRRRRGRAARDARAHRARRARRPATAASLGLARRRRLECVPREGAGGRLRGDRAVDRARSAAARRRRWRPGATRCYEPTSAARARRSASRTTTRCCATFRSLFAVWAHDLLAHALRPRSGRTFMSVSPPVAGATTASRTTASISARSAARAGGPLHRHAAAHARSRRRFATRSRARSSRLRDLEIVSVWNPGYLLNPDGPLRGAARTAAGRASPANGARCCRATLVVGARSGRRCSSCRAGPHAAAAVPARALAQRLPHAHGAGQGPARDRSADHRAAGAGRRLRAARRRAYSSNSRTTRAASGCSTRSRRTRRTRWSSRSPAGCCAIGSAIACASTGRYRGTPLLRVRRARRCGVRSGRREAR